MKRIFTACVTAAMMLLAGCAETPLVHVGNRVFNFGTGLPDDMLGRHVAGMVAFDEDWVGNYGRIARNALYAQGIAKGTPEYGLRVVRINLNNTGELLWKKKGSLLFMTGAIVPDHLPPLKAGDTVEIRNVSTWHAMEDFLAKGEGNIVVRILCRKADPNYEACLNDPNGPSVGDIRGVGETGTPYPEKVADYGFTFTPLYDEKGNKLR
ncbi:hypothetical protein [Caldimonas thermodepolymerans]|jgi:hypothetical protein|uniref:hypothetical protein n=1 Tax=Caldimonas thermodepolymerans TaxID=215580 RepID=UPI00248FF43C|nr:hypothetical protein [Caldimonas thermodepolymerans]